MAADRKTTIGILAPAMLLLWLADLAVAQQPFLTDDADTSPKGHFHGEILWERDRLQDSAYPALRQNATRLQLTYGLFDKLEVGFDTPLLAIHNAAPVSPINAVGFGDADFQNEVSTSRGT